jgi:lipoprotein-anchoring transpeptidase ErfK/SrfK
MLRLGFVGIAFAATLTLPLSAHAVAIDTDALALQVALDRAGFSPGVIDGTMGLHTRQAISGFQQAKGIIVTGKADAETWAALGDQAEATQMIFISEADAEGPFVSHIPESMAERAKLDGLHYTSIEEALAEKYHTKPETLRTLNPGADFAPGEQITVPAAGTDAISGETTDEWDATLDKLSVAKTHAAAAKIVVDKSDRQVRVLDSADQVIALFPASVGSTHDPLPTGQWKINGVARNPPFHYNPELFWDAEKFGKSRMTLPPGPNGPVGVVWIDLSKSHYGIHGTPEPQTVGRTYSHGCIRLTNWDAAKLAQMVKPGTPAILQD